MTDRQTDGQSQIYSPPLELRTLVKPFNFTIFYHINNKDEATLNIVTVKLRSPHILSLAIIELMSLGLYTGRNM